MDFSSCHFYNMKSKKKIFESLYIDDKLLKKISNDYRVYISKKDGKERLVEEPKGELKRVQKRIKQLLDKTLVKNFPEYIMCKKNSSWIDVAKYHKFSNTIISFDISKFFPSISYDKIVRMFTKHLKTSTTVAEILAQLISIDYEKIYVKKEVDEWYKKENEKRKHPLPNKHLSTGSAVSVMIAELVGYDMFEEMNAYCKKHGFLFTTYVDDLHISSVNRISKVHCKKILAIIKKNGFEYNNQKLRVYLPNSDAIITGVVKKRRDSKITIKYSMENKIADWLNHFDNDNKQKIKSMLNTIKLIDAKKFNYYNKALQKKERE